MQVRAPLREREHRAGKEKDGKRRKTLFFRICRFLFLETGSGTRSTPLRGPEPGGQFDCFGYPQWWPVLGNGTRFWRWGPRFPWVVGP
jgi:hypothetical protein